MISFVILWSLFVHIIKCVSCGGFISCFMYWGYFATLSLNYESWSKKYWVSNRCIKLKQGYFIHLNVVPILTNHEISFSLCALFKNSFTCVIYCVLFYFNFFYLFYQYYQAPLYQYAHYCSDNMLMLKLSY